MSSSSLFGSSGRTSFYSSLLLFTLKYCVASVNIFPPEEPLEDYWDTLTTPELLIGWNIFVFEGYNSSEMQCHILSVTIEGDLIKTESFHRRFTTLTSCLDGSQVHTKPGDRGVRTLQEEADKERRLVKV